MTQPSRVGETALAKAAWVAVVLLLAASYSCVVAPMQSALAATQARAQMLYERANADEEVVRNSDALTAVRDRVDADVSSLSGQRSQSAATAAVLRLVDIERKNFHIDVNSIEPGDSSEAPSRVAGLQITHDPLIAEDLALGVRGTFRDLLGLFADISRHGVLLDVRGVELDARSQDDAGQPIIDATVQVTLYRLPSLRNVEASFVARAIR